MGSEKKTSVLRILNLIDQFCDAHLNDEYNSYATGLMDRITNMPDLNLSRGRPEIWAAAIVTVIARLNFLFDKADLDAITMEDISTFFGAIKSTVGNKATVIEKACNIDMGEAGLCREEITEALTFYETSEGLCTLAAGVRLLNMLVKGKKYWKAARQRTIIVCRKKIKRTTTGMIAN